MAEKILIVDDDKSICQLLNLYMVKEGFVTHICHNGLEALDILKKELFDVVLLDIMMPEMDGIATLAEIRKNSKIPVILVSAKGDSIDKISGLDTGADDYVTKPFEPQELISRIKALLRRLYSDEQNAKKNDVTIGDLQVNLSNYTVLLAGEKLDMPPKEIELLHFLATNPMIVFDRGKLLNKVWGIAYTGDTRTVDVHIKRLREKIGESKDWRLDTVWGVGYKFEILKKD